jgi:RNA polymerase sigma-70 factor, ECF subfamily
MERTSNEEGERRLIEGLRRNDRESVATVYDSYSRIAYGLALHVLGAAADAEDVVQESFVALWRQAERLDASRGIKSYLLTIVHNKAVDHLRQRGRRPENVLNLEAPIPATSGDPEESAARSADRESVRAALVALPDEQRRTVEMAYFGGLTLNEVASRMQVPLGTVKSRLRLAMGHLRRQLAQQ